MTVVLRVIDDPGDVTHRPGDPAGMWVVDIDVDAYGGRGEAELTHVLEEARRFANAGVALTYWRRQSKVKPRRLDGQPNRPGTAFTVMVEEG